MARLIPVLALSLALAGCGGGLFEKVAKALNPVPVDLVADLAPDIKPGTGSEPALEAGPDFRFVTSILSHVSGY